ncbi:MAG: hypothetical protein JW778_00635 [Candidatus Altiarchaeota archaeon]|nr:hypothetical protein [Candidatus Altiarchaeota archaeon]
MELYAIVFIALAIIVYVMVPGLMISLALFPKRKDLDPVERAGVSTILGLIPTLLLYFLDKNFSMPIDSYTTTATFLLVSFIGFAGWQYHKRG